MDLRTLTHKVIGDINSDLILQEVKQYLNRDEHVFLQKGQNFIFDIPYTNSLIQKYNMRSSRIMCLDPKQCYTWHKDQSPRIHFPLITDNRCLFVLEDKAFHMEINHAHYVDTRKMHTALNGTKDLCRYHIVGKSNELL